MRYVRTLAVLSVVMFTACASSPSAPTTPTTPATPTASLATPPASPGSPVRGNTRVAVIVLENRNYDQVIGDPAAPYINELAKSQASATASYAVSHPSLPNYLALVGGSTFGVTSDCTDCLQSAPNLGSQLQAAGIGWRAYMEGMPGACFAGASDGGYAKKHDPFMYFHDIADDPAVCGNVVPFTRFATDLSSGRLADFVWITPDLCNDGHDCGNATVDAWLRQQLPPLLSALGSKGIAIVTWDESDNDDTGCCGVSPGGGHIVTVVAGPGARKGARLTAPVNHYSTLLTIEEIFGLRPLGMAADPRTKPLDPLLAPGVLP